MKYARIDGGKVVEIILPATDEDGAVIPIDRRFHADFIATLIAIPEGREVAAADTWSEATGFGPPANLPAMPATIPQRVTMRQARLALLVAGKLSAVSGAIAGLPDPQREAALIEWEFAAEIERASPFLQQLAALIHLDDQALDALFIDAATR